LPQGALPLLQFVRGPAALSRRLSQIGVVDAADGKRLQSELKPGQRLVTREGALWRWDGYTAAADAPTASARRLEQRNRLADVEAQLQEARAFAAEMRAAFEAARLAAEDALAREQDARRAQRDAQ